MEPRRGPPRAVRRCLSRNRIRRNDLGGRLSRLSCLEISGCVGRPDCRRHRGDGPAAVGDWACWDRACWSWGDGREVDGGRAVCGERAAGGRADARADGGRRRPGGASHASQRRRPSRSRAATQSRIGTNLGRARLNYTSSTSVRPRRTAPFRPATPPLARPAARTRRRLAPPRREGRAERSIPLPRRRIKRACGT
jgi:hypothetical protein